MSGTICVASQDQARFHTFTQCYQRLETPEGWAHATHHCYDTAYGRNRLVQMAVGDYVFFLDDDVCFEPDILKRLLKHNVDVVGALYLRRMYPFNPAPHTSLEGPPGLRKSKLAATGALLVKKSVFDKIEYPWFLSTYTEDGQPVSDDGYFCHELLKAGVSIYVDTSVWVGHMGTCVVRPIYKNGQWKIGVGVPGGTDGTAVDIEIEPSVRTTQ